MGASVLNTVSTERYSVHGSRSVGPVGRSGRSVGSVGRVGRSGRSAGRPVSRFFAVDDGGGYCGALARAAVAMIERKKEGRTNLSLSWLDDESLGASEEWELEKMRNIQALCEKRWRGKGIASQRYFPWCEAQSLWQVVRASKGGK